VRRPGCLQKSPEPCTYIRGQISRGRRQRQGPRYGFGHQVVNLARLGENLTEGNGITGGDQRGQVGRFGLVGLVVARWLCHGSSVWRCRLSRSDGFFV
jgi:hypothetical protein